MRTADEKYRRHDIDFLMDLNDELFHAFEIEYQRRLLAAAYHSVNARKEGE